MQGWKEMFLSQAGKEVMIKEVVQSIPAYSMGVFKLLVCLCKDIEAMICFGGVVVTRRKSIGLSGALFAP